jgi:hypothetical protein
MARPIRLFVSSSPDLAAEREAIGQSVAELPISVGWKIKHTPGAGERAGQALDFLARCDVCIVVLGADFAAPMGLEWQNALGGESLLLAYRKRGLYSPSAQQLLRKSAVAWTQFESTQELKTQVAQALAQTVLDSGETFGLHLRDIEGLLSVVDAAGEPRAGDDQAVPDRRRGADRGGVILGRDT